MTNQTTGDAADPNPVDNPLIRAVSAARVDYSCRQTEQPQNLELRGTPSEPDDEWQVDSFLDVLAAILLDKMLGDDNE